MMNLAALNLRRTTSASSLPRVRPILHFLLSSVITISLFMVARSWFDWKGWRVHSPRGGLSGTRSQIQGRPALVYRENLRPSKNFIFRREVKADLWSLCEAPGFSIKLMLVLPEDERFQDRVEHVISSLQRADYGSCQVHLLFVLPKDVSGRAAALVDQLDWTAGKVYSRTWAESAPPKDQVIPAWTPQGDKEFLIVLDRLDKLRVVDERFFPFTLQCLSKYFIEAKTAERKPSVAARRVAGVSLAPSPREARTLQWELAEPQALLQRGDGWTMYLPWFWRELATYHEWRLTNEAPMLPITPAPFEGGLWTSYLNEFMNIVGYTVLYNPQTTTYLGTLQNKQKGLFGQLASLKNIPVLDSIYQLVGSLEELANRRAERHRGEYNVQASPTASSSTCFLDRFSDPIEPQASKRKYLLYEPHGTWIAQVDALKKAMVLASTLNRTLILPPFVHPEGVKHHVIGQNSSVEHVAGERLVDLNRLFRWKATWLRETSHENFPFEQFHLDRHVLFRTRALRYDLMQALDNPIMDAKNLTMGEEVMIPALAATDQEVLDALGGCRDTILGIRNFNLAIETFDESEAALRYQELTSTWGLSTALEDLISSLRNGSIWPSDLTCTIYSRGNGKIPCGMDIFDSKEKGLLYYRSCQAGPARVVEYALEAAKVANVTTGAIYLMKEVPCVEAIPPQVGANVKVYSIANLTTEITVRPELGIPPVLADHIASMLERELCGRSALFVNNMYSPLGRLIAEYRGNQSLPVQTIGLALQ